MVIKYVGGRIIIQIIIGMILLFTKYSIIAFWWFNYITVIMYSLLIYFTSIYVKYINNYNISKDSILNSTIFSQYITSKKPEIDTPKYSNTPTNITCNNTPISALKPHQHIIGFSMDSTYSAYSFVSNINNNNIIMLCFDLYFCCIWFFFS